MTVLKKGLLANERVVHFGNVQHVFLDVYAADGYRFYNRLQPENYDDDGVLLPENLLTYLSAYTSRKDKLDLNNLVAVPIPEFSLN